MSISISRRDLHGIFSKYQNAIDNPDLANKRLAKRGLTESNAEHGPRPVYRMGRPLKDLSGDPNDHSLFVHHGVYIPPVMWEFQKGQKNKIGKHKLRISADPNPDLSKWKTYELAGTTHRSDAEINNSCKFGIAHATVSCPLTTIQHRPCLQKSQSQELLLSQSEWRQLSGCRGRR